MSSTDILLWLFFCLFLLLIAELPVAGESDTFHRPQNRILIQQPQGGQVADRAGRSATGSANVWPEIGSDSPWILLAVLTLFCITGHVPSNRRLSCVKQLAACDCVLRVFNSFLLIVSDFQSWHSSFQHQFPQRRCGAWPTFFFIFFFLSSGIRESKMHYGSVANRPTACRLRLEQGDFSSRARTFC